MFPVIFGQKICFQGIKMQYFAFRWLSLLLSQVFEPLLKQIQKSEIILFWLQEFPLPDVLSLWDALLTDETR